CRTSGWRAANAYIARTSLIGLAGLPLPGSGGQAGSHAVSFTARPGDCGAGVAGADCASSFCAADDVWTVSIRPPEANRMSESQNSHATIVKMARRRSFFSRGRFSSVCLTCLSVLRWIKSFSLYDLYRFEASWKIRKSLKLSKVSLERLGDLPRLLIRRDDFYEIKRRNYE